MATNQTSTSTRRAILAGAAAIPALSLPAIAAGNPDAELLALGKQFDELEAGYHDANERNAAHDEAYEAALRQMKDGGYESGSNDYFKETLDSLMKDAPPESQPTWEHFADRMNPIQRQIARLSATTLDGLKVKARSAKFAAAYFWDASDNDADWDHLMARNAIDAILDMNF